MMMLRLTMLMLVMVLPASSWAAIAFVSQTDATATANVSSVTYSQVVSAGTDRALKLCSAVRHNGPDPFAISSVTFNGSETFTKVRHDIETHPSAGLRTEIWVLPAPTVTTANIVVNYAGANVSGIAVSSTLLTGVSQTSPVDSHAGSNGSSTTPTVTITTIADNAAVSDCAIGKSDTGLTVGAGQTMRTDRLLPTINDGVGVSTIIPQTPAGAVVMDWTQVSSFEWATSAVSLTPSGGSDPNPSVPSQVTIGWTNGTDPGSPSSGIASTTVRRCTGASCDATTAQAITTRAFPITTYVDTTVQTNTTYGYSNFHTDGVGLVSTNTATVRITTSATPPATPPTIASVAYDNTGVTITPGAVIPTKVRIWTFTSQGVVTDVTVPWASLTAGRYNQTWYDGLQGSCVSGIGSTDLENRADGAYQCVDLFTLGLVEALDITPPTLTCPTPINLPAGVTSWTFSCDVNKPNTAARFDTSAPVAYALMANNMSANSLTFSGTVTGLTNNSTTTRYVRGTTLHPFETNDVDGYPINYPNTTSYAVVINVAAAPGDVTPPGNVASLIGSLAGNTATISWAAATDAVSYQVYQSTDNITFAPAGNPVAVTSTQFSLNFGTVYYWKIKAYDVVNNLSASFSNTLTLTTPAAPDVERPSRMTGLAAAPYSRTVLLTWTRGDDNSGQVFGNIESCLVEVGQTDCVNFSALVGDIAQTFLTPDLISGRRYCFQGKNADAAGNVSLLYSGTICADTPTTGLDRPRQLVPFGQDRTTGTRSAAGTRLPRP